MRWPRPFADLVAVGQRRSIQPDPVTGDGHQGRSLFLTQGHISGQQVVLVVQPQGPRLRQQTVGVPAKRRDHSDHLSPGADVAIDLRCDGGCARVILQN